MAEIATGAEVDCGEDDKAAVGGVGEAPNEPNDQQSHNHVANPRVKLPRFVDTGLFGFEESTMGKTRAAYPPEFRRPDGRAGARRSLAGGAGRRVRADGTVDQKLGRAICTVTPAVAMAA